MPPITISDVHAARERIRPYLTPTPARRYPTLDAAIGHGIRVVVKHENHNPTQAFKARNGISALTALSADARARGVVAASTGNHGQGLAYAAHLLNARATICVPVGNNPDKNAMIRGWGARLVEDGANYDEAAVTADRLVRDEGLTLVHSTNNRDVIAGAATMSLEFLEQAPDIDALVLAVGGGSQAVGAITVSTALKQNVTVYGVQSTLAPNGHDSWHARKRLPIGTTRTFADGIATRTTYDLTFDALLTGLAGFVAVDDDELLAAMRLYWAHAHNLPEGAGAAGLAGLLRLREQLAGKTVGVVISGSNCDARTAMRALGE
ncbi:MAG TPA: threonine/serine dehydratase [Gemmatimonadaceae bacterium]|nr:threonine/serine dehydratase [Gemmatimonadaceae bacterium]